MEPTYHVPGSKISGGPQGQITKLLGQKRNDDEESGQMIVNAPVARYRFDLVYRMGYFHAVGMGFMLVTGIAALVAACSSLPTDTVYRAPLSLMAGVNLFSALCYYYKLQARLKLTDVDSKKTEEHPNYFDLTRKPLGAVEAAVSSWRAVDLMVSFPMINASLLLLAGVRWNKTFADVDPATPDQYIIFLMMALSALAILFYVASFCFSGHILDAKPSMAEVVVYVVAMFLTVFMWVWIGSAYWEMPNFSYNIGIKDSDQLDTIQIFVGYWWFYIAEFACTFLEWIVMYLEVRSMNDDTGNTMQFQWGANYRIFIIILKDILLVFADFVAKAAFTIYIVLGSYGVWEKVVEAATTD